MSTQSSQISGQNSKVADQNAPSAKRTASSRAWTNLDYSVVLMYVVLAVALMVPLVSLGRWMLGRDYYQHFPLLLIAAGAVAVMRLRTVRVVLQPNFTVRVLGWSLLAIGLTAAVFVVPSRWTASLAALALMAAAINFVGGRRLAVLLMGPMLLLLAAVPLPVGFDNWFVVALQNLATRLASYWLELAGVMHFTTGVSIETIGQDYFVEDACSGIHSVFAAMAVGLGYGVLRHYSLPRVFLFLAQLLFWVVVTNALRVFMTVYGQAEMGLDLSGGTYHELLGLLTFSTGVLLAISGDHFVRYIVPGNRDVEFTWEAALELVKQRRFIDTKLSPQFLAGLSGSFACVGAIIAFVFFSYSAPVGRALSIEEMAGLTYVVLDDVDGASLPASVSGWKQVNFVSEERDDDSIFGGMVSHIWSFSNEAGRTVLVSLDGPYDSWHDLAVCYQGIGWTVDNMQTVNLEGAEDSRLVCELALSRPPIERSQILYACVSSEGEFVEPAQYFGNMFMQAARRFRRGLGDHGGEQPGVIQIQLLDSGPGDISERRKKENAQLFEGVVEALLLKGQVRT